VNEEALALWGLSHQKQTNRWPYIIYGAFDQKIKFPGSWLHVEALESTVLTYLLTPWNRVLLEKLTGSAASQEIPRFFGTRRFITVLTSARHLSLS